MGGGTIAGDQLIESRSALHLGLRQGSSGRNPKLVGAAICYGRHGGIETVVAARSPPAWATSPTPV
jgi:hypothetical protein